MLSTGRMRAMDERMKNRRDLIELTELYLEALIEKRPGTVPVKEDCRITYNGSICSLGDNELWKNTLVITQRQTMIDPDTKEIVFFGVMTNEPLEKVYCFPTSIHVHSVYYAATIRLKVDNGKICEVEELASARRMRNFYCQLEEIRLPDLEFEIPIPEEERSTKEELRQLVEDYWDCIAQTKDSSALRVHPDAQRFENGYKTTNHTYSFRGDFKHNKGFHWETPASSRNYPVIDPVRGLVVSSCMLEGNSNTDDGDRGVRVVEAFKIKDGAICHLIAHFPVLPKSCGWDTADEKA